MTRARRGRGSLVLIVVLLAGAALLTAFGGIDRWFAELFFTPADWFLGNHEPYLTLRHGTTFTAWGIGIFLLVGLVWRVALERPMLGLSRGAIVYLLVVFALGPTILVNGILKEYWGRARPAHTEQFGQHKHYTPPLVIAHECRSNCSFVSGEAALGFSFMAFGFVAGTRTRRRLGFAAGILMGSSFGLLRIIEGGHYLSDVYFAGLFMALVAWLCSRWFETNGWL